MVARSRPGFELKSTVGDGAPSCSCGCGLVPCAAPSFENAVQGYRQLRADTDTPRPGWSSMFVSAPQYVIRVHKRTVELARRWGCVDLASSQEAQSTHPRTRIAGWSQKPITRRPGARPGCPCQPVSVGTPWTRLRAREPRTEAMTARVHVGAPVPLPQCSAVSATPSQTASRHARPMPRRLCTSLPGRMDGPVCLIVNPHAGAGRALKLLPGVEAELRAQGRPFRVERTTSMDHARELAREAAARRRDRGRDGRRRHHRRDRRRAQSTARACWRSSPAGAGTTSRASSGSRSTPAEAAKLLQTGAERAVDLAEAGGSGVPRHPQRRDRLRRQPDRARDAPEARDVRLHLRHAARAHQLEGGRPGSSRSTARPARLPAIPWPSATPACSAAGCSWRRMPSSTTVCSTSC